MTNDEIHEVLAEVERDLRATRTECAKLRRALKLEGADDLCSGVLLERDALRKERDDLKRQRDELAAADENYDCVNREREEIARRLEQVTEERNKLRRELDESKRQLRLMTEDRDDVLLEAHTKLQYSCAKALSERDDLRLQLSITKKRAAELEADFGRRLKNFHSTLKALEDECSTVRDERDELGRRLGLVYGLSPSHSPQSLREIEERLARLEEKVKP